MFRKLLNDPCVQFFDQQWPVIQSLRTLTEKAEFASCKAYIVQRIKDNLEIKEGRDFRVVFWSEVSREIREHEAKDSNIFKCADVIMDVINNKAGDVPKLLNKTMLELLFDIDDFNNRIDRLNLIAINAEQQKLKPEDFQSVEVKNLGAAPAAVNKSAA